MSVTLNVSLKDYIYNFSITTMLCPIVMLTILKHVNITVMAVSRIVFGSRFNASNLSLLPLVAHRLGSLLANWQVARSLVT